MIDYFEGTVKEIADNEIVIDLGVVGVSMCVARGQLFEKGKKTKIYSYLHWNAENGPSLFGFSSSLERSVFKVITSCSGIGPKIALAVLADLGAQGFLQAIQTSDEHMLSKVNGIGKKKAEQIIVALKHKVATLIESGVDVGDAKEVTNFHEVTQALQSLNYSRTEITNAMEYVKKNTQITNASFDQLLRHALSYLSKTM